jgi:CheY-like chemotaxis protein
MKTILIVDDELDILSALKAIFTIEQYQVFTATNGRVAMEVLQHVHPDVILTDWMMPEMNGVELCREVRSDPNLTGIPIVVSSAAATHPQGQPYWDHFLSKPVEIRDLLDLIRDFSHPA